MTHQLNPTRIDQDWLGFNHVVVADQDNGGAHTPLCECPSMWDFGMGEIALRPRPCPLCAMLVTQAVATDEPA